MSKKPKVPEIPDVIKEPICEICQHLLYWPYCMAFPGGKGIPMDIRNGENDHKKPIPGDNGFMFTPIKAASTKKMLTEDELDSIQPRNT